jgi:hypothetical protein
VEGERPPLEAVTEQCNEDVAENIGLSVIVVCKG